MFSERPDEGDAPDGAVAFGYLNRPPVPLDSAALFQIADDLEVGCASCLIIDQLGAVWVIVVIAVSDCEVIKRHAMGVTAPDCFFGLLPDSRPEGSVYRVVR
jgi:hypothetical protein